MFQLRTEHMDAFGRASLENFEERVAADLRETWPEETAELSDVELTRRVHAAIERGEKYGLTTEFELACVAEAAVLLGPQFDQDPRLEKAYLTLRQQELTPKRKAVLLCRYTHKVMAERS